MGQKKNVSEYPDATILMILLFRQSCAMVTIWVTFYRTLLVLIQEFSVRNMLIFLSLFCNSMGVMHLRFFLDL